MRMVDQIMVAAALTAAACPPAFAARNAPDGAVRSVYTTFDTMRCRHSGGDTDEEDDGRWTCPGFGRDRIFIWAGDQRAQVSFGPTRRDHVAATETFPAFNDAYVGTVEWRVARGHGGKPAAFATILRWNVMTPDDIENAKGPTTPSGRVLVVTRIGRQGSCQVGYVDARLNPDANDLARRLADERARTFRCGVDKPKWVGRVAP